MDDPKQIVASGYDRCASAYLAARAREPHPELAMLVERLPSAARVLDIGCGAGVPVTAALARVATVVGVDISASQIQLARENVPSAQFIHADIMERHFERALFDAVVAYYMLFHLPRDEQQDLLSRLGLWIRPGGYVLATLGASDHPGYTEADFFGATMYWSHHETPWYAERLVEAGFEIIHLGVIEDGYRDEAGLRAERHPVVLARLRPARLTSAAEG